MDAMCRHVCPVIQREEHDEYTDGNSFAAGVSVNRSSVRDEGGTLLTAVVWEGQDAEQVLRVDLGQNGEAGQRSSPAGDVQRRVPALIHQARVAASLQQHLQDVRLLHDDGQVERGLEKNTTNNYYPLLINIQQSFHFKLIL